MKHLLPLLALFLASGCFLSRAYTNEPVDGEVLAQLVPGQTKAPEAVTLLGAPSEVVQLGRRSAYRYEHRQSKRAGLWLLLVFFVNSDSHADRTWLFFDEQDVLSHVGTTLQAEEVEWMMPWTDHD